jgi:hypothetical protein
MRVLMRKIIRKLVEIPFTWKILHFFYRLFYRFRLERELLEEEQKQVALGPVHEKMKSYFRNLVVMNGPFKAGQTHLNSQPGINNLRF